MKGHGDFSIGSSVWPGISKLIEECGEVEQVAGKLIGSAGDPHHWDGTHLRDRLETELGDLTAAIEFVVKHNGLARDVIEHQYKEKLALFEKWHQSGQMKQPKDVLRVVGGLAVRDGRILMGKRPAGKLRPGMWEYPGGKVDPGESDTVALAREWREELDVRVDVGEHIGDVAVDFEVPIVWALYRVRSIDSYAFSGALHALAHEELDWVLPAHVIANRACTPTTYLIYPKVRDYMAEILAAAQR